MACGPKYASTSFDSAWTVREGSPNFLTTSSRLVTPGSTPFQGFASAQPDKSIVVAISAFCIVTRPPVSPSIRQCASSPAPYAHQSPLVGGRLLRRSDPGPG